MNPFPNVKHDIRTLEFLLPLPDRQPFGLTEVKTWVGKVFKEIFSIAFKAFSDEELSLNATKIFCSENILKNFIHLNSRWYLSNERIQQLDSYIQDDLLPYLKMMYPIAKQTINQNLSELLKQVQLTNLTGSNYIQNSEIKWQYRQSGIYNDLIMNTLNHVIKKIDQPSEFTFDNKGSNYQDFKSMMKSIFQRVQDFDYMVLDNGQLEESMKWVYKGILKTAGISRREIQKMEQEQLMQGNQEESIKDKLQRRDQYAAKVRKYTSYSVSRKVPEGTSLYTNKEIQSMNIPYKSSAILRIIEKWCNQLIHKFKVPNYFQGQRDSSYDRTSDLTSFLRADRIQLDRLMEQQKQQIDSFQKRNVINSYKMQALLLDRERMSYEARGHEFIGELEWKAGIFSLDLITHFHNYLVSYLNRLIHGILKVSKQFYQLHKQREEIQWSAPPKLLTFTISDLMRCNFKSKEKQIKKIINNFQDLNNVHSDNRISFLQVKNRLQQKTHDLSLIFKFNNDIICQVQLTIENDLGQNKFFTNSNLFSHYLYELERSNFGPLIEICNLWVNMDTHRFEIYQRLRKKGLTLGQGQKYCNRHKPVIIVDPFICDLCKEVYSHNYYIKEHKQCHTCGRKYCAKCIIAYERQNNDRNLLDTFVLDPQIKKQQIKLFTLSQYRKNHEKLPDEGVCIEIQSKLPKLQFFKVVPYQAEKYLLGWRRDDIYQIEKINTKEQAQDFLTKYLVFQVCLSQEHHYHLDYKTALTKYILPTIQCKNFKKYDFKIAISENLSDDDLIEHFKKIDQLDKKSVRQLLLDNNKIQNIGTTIVQYFPKVEFLDLNKNSIVHYERLQTLTHLKHLQLSHTQLQEIPLNLYKLQELERLKISFNSISRIQPEIQQLQKLKILEINNNEIKFLPHQLQKCKNLTIMRCEHNFFEDCFRKENALNFQAFENLKELNIGYNGITIFPPGLCKLKNLKVLKINNNEIQLVHPNIGSLTNLVQLNLETNKLTKMVASFKNLEKLKKLYLGQNSKLNQLPQDLAKCPCLQELYLPKCNFEVVPLESRINSLKILDLQCNKIENLQYFLGEFRKIEHLNLSHNSFSENFIPQFNKVLSEMRRLRTIDLTKCQCTRMPKFSVCDQLQIINISNNTIQEIEMEFEGMNHLTQLNASFNKIRKVNESLTKLQSLINLDLHFNSIYGIPVLGVDCKKWPRLQRLNLSSNQLNRLPDVICECSRLVKLNVSGNKLTELPKQFINLRALKELDISDNHFKGMEEMRQTQLMDHHLHGARSTEDFIYIKKHMPSLKIIGQNDTNYQENSNRIYKDNFLITSTKNLSKNRYS